MYDTVVQIGGYDPKMFEGFNYGRPKVYKTVGFFDDSDTGEPVWALKGNQFKIHSEVFPGVSDH